MHEHAGIEDYGIRMANLNNSTICGNELQYDVLRLQTSALTNYSNKEDGVSW